MDLKQRLESCTKCEKRKFGDTGIVCSLTDEKPTFQFKCEDFQIDSKEAQKIIARAKYSNYNNGNNTYQEEETRNPIWVFIGVVIFIIKLIAILT